MKNTYIIVLLFLASVGLRAQNPCGTLACNDNVLLSLDSNGEAVIPYGAFVEGFDPMCLVTHDYRIAEIDELQNPLSTFGPTLNLTCEDIGTGMFLVEVEEIATGIVNSCWGGFEVEDKLEACVMVPPGNLPLILERQNLSGTIGTDVLLNANPLWPEFDWLYEIPETDILPGENIITFEANGDVQTGMVGITTIDLLSAMGVLFDDPDGLPVPMRVVAMDVDGSGSFGVNDLVLVRQMILSIITEFPIGNYLFVPHNFVFGADFDPYDFDYNFKEFKFHSDTLAQTEFRFRTYALGNISDIDNFNSPAIEDRNRSTDYLTYENSYVEEGEDFEVRLSIEKADIAGLQMAINFSELDLVGVDHDYLGKDIMTRKMDNEWRVSYATVQPRNDFMVVLNFVALQGGYISDFINLNEAFTQELVDGNLLPSNIELRMNEKVSNSHLSVSPNPIIGISTIAVTDNSEQEITVYDLQGRKIMVLPNNNRVVEAVDFPASGIYFIRSANGSEVLSEKIIVIKK